MMTAETDPPRSDAELFRVGAAAIRARLPATWSVAARGGAAGELVLRAPDGQQVVVAVEVRNVFRSDGVAAVRDRLVARTRDRSDVVGVLFARYLAGTTRQRLAAAGLGYLDATGNILLRSDSPPLYLSDRGAAADPWRGRGRPRGGLGGEPAAKVVRALADHGGPWGIRELVGASRASTGSVYRVIDFLEGEELVCRADGRIDVPDWRALLRRWSVDYQFLHSNSVTRWIAPRGLPALLERVRGSGVDYALTGSIAASAWAPHAPARSAMVYTPEPELAAAAWGLRRTETGANVLLAEPGYDVLLERTGTGELGGLVTAAPAQVAVDLLSGPGRAPAEAEELLDWMVSNENSWRRSR